jgi:hypothetical protein
MLRIQKRGPKIVDLLLLLGLLVVGGFFSLDCTRIIFNVWDFLDGAPPWLPALQKFGIIGELKLPQFGHIHLLHLHQEPIEPVRSHDEECAHLHDGRVC